MKLHLVDLNSVLVEQWRLAFDGLPDVDVACADILAVARGALVSPANGGGHMDGGIDRDYAAWLGGQAQRAVYDAVARRAEGRIPVGAAELVATGHARVPWLIVAPTMDVPEPVPASNCYRALRAALRVAERNPDRIAELYCPGLGTGIGSVEEGTAARAMAEAYRDWIGVATG
jgi:O-acetyl-ADP-ribose deacetylase (regulator of RNase III)